ERFAQAIQDTLAGFRTAGEGSAGPSLRRCEELAREVDAHALMEGTPARREAVWMATRLLRCLATAASQPQGVADAGGRFRDELAFADWARDLLTGGDDHPAVSAAYRSLEQAGHQRRRAFNHSFAAQLGEATARQTAPEGLLPVEGFLDEVLAPLAEA